MNKELPIGQETLVEMLNEIFKHNKEQDEFMHTQALLIEEQANVLEGYKHYTQAQINNFEAKFKSINAQAPKPDLSDVKEILIRSLNNIEQRIDSGPKPIIKQFRFLLFPEQVRSSEYYGIMLTRLILGVLGLVLLILGYLLLNKLIK